ncbi:MAG: hypothetical protein IJ658_13245 [Kiritimatiellae bacterium]|nr:hypothetical protein [Kiritimatiellia bacterium]
MAIAAETAHAAGAPMDWQPVRTNEIARWKAERKAPDGVVADRAARTVTFLMEATGIDAKEPIEFLAIGPLSDRAYESFGVTVASPEAISAAIESIGVPRGVPASPPIARFWPQGERLTLAAKPYGENAGPPFALDGLLSDKQAKEAGPILDKPFVYTGGARDDADMPIAATNIPCAVFALYSHGPSLLQLNGLFDQSSTYGRFTAGKSLAAGTLLEIKLTWDGASHVKTRTPAISATNIAEVLQSLQADATPDTDLFVTPVFDDSVTVSRAGEIAKAFEMLDGNGLKMNGAAKDQFFYKAFLPDPAWRNRQGRLFQPFEIRLASDGSRTFTFVEEDWSGDGFDPVLKPKTRTVSDWSELPACLAQTGDQGAKVTVAFVHAPADTPVTRLSPIVKALTPRIGTFYVFSEQAAAHVELPVVE